MVSPSFKNAFLTLLLALSTQLVLAAEEGHPHAFRIGAGAAAQIPHVFNGSVDLKIADLWGFYIATGGYKSKYQDYDFGIDNKEIGLRFYPWRKMFFIGVGGGIQKARVVTSKTFSVTYGDTAISSDGSFEVDTKSNYVTPLIGWEIVTESGITFGFDIGYQFTTRFESTISSNFAAYSGETNEFIQDQQDYLNTKHDIETLVNNYGKRGIPHITLLRLGYYY